MDEKGWAKVGGSCLMAVPILYAVFSWIGRIGKTSEFDLPLTVSGAMLFAAGAVLFYKGKAEG